MNLPPSFSSVFVSKPGNWVLMALWTCVRFSFVSSIIWWQKNYVELSLSFKACSHLKGGCSLSNAPQWKHFPPYFWRAAALQATFSAPQWALHCRVEVLLSLGLPKTEKTQQILNEIVWLHQNVNEKVLVFDWWFIFISTRWFLTWSSAGIERSSKCTILPCLLISCTTKSEYLKTNHEWNDLLKQTK